MGQKKGSLELSLNSITTFILAIIVFSAGITIVATVFHNAPNPNIYIKNCQKDLNNKLSLQNQIFAVCPESITTNPVELEKGIKIEAGFQNLDGTAKVYYVNGSHDPITRNNELKISPLSYNVTANSVRYEPFLIRYHNAQSGKPIYKRIVFCKEGPSYNPPSSGYADCPQNQQVSRLITINVK